MHDTTTSKDIFIKLLQILFEYGFDLKKLVCLCTDGAPNMVGRHAGVAAKLRAEIEKVNPGSSFAHFHCIIHQQYLCSKILKMENTISLVTKTVNYIRGHPLNHRQFNKLLTDINNQFSDISFYTPVSWLSLHKVVKRFYLLRSEIILFMEMKGQNTDEMKSQSWIKDLAFAVDIITHMNDLNLELQGKDKLITQLSDHIKCFISKIKLWKFQLLNEDLSHFPTCKELRSTVDAHNVMNFSQYERQLESLLKEFQERFNDFSSFEQQFSLFASPFSFNVSIADESLQMELLEIQSDSILKAKYLEVGIPAFFSYLPGKFKNFKKFATKIIAMFGSTYVCEQLFSFMKMTKTAQRTRLTDEHLSSLIKVGTTRIAQPDISKIVSKKRCQSSGSSSHQN
ncbi:general transcription factor II-I repeat domain-containing protein 2-like [Octopus sinensis]|uniref:General transcription factor II-I repeat domain-containing protein 2-like n=1 Tax=Octopus sinensis TaxID=2607531 RepID=A0A6P7TWC4_9MOLL|nr:general transcription factor II-I repeat domain-containing protein 2-like [Octopus sinensis]